MKIKPGSQYSFSTVPQANIPRSKFNRSHGLKTTFNAGYLIPVFVDEALPGDTFNLRMTSFSRLATPIYPIMDNMYLESFFFAIPYRLVWSNWEKFNGAQDNPGDSTTFTVPVSSAPASMPTGYTEGTLQDYMGLPTKIASITHSNLPLRCYNLVWNSWFRDENLQNSAHLDTGNGPDTYSNYVLLQRGKRHDYFTSALPWPQKGTAVSIPLGSTAPVNMVGGTTNCWQAYDSASGNKNTLNQPIAANGSGDVFSSGGANPVLKFDPRGSLYADLSSATAATINQLRSAFQIQRMYERDARGGTRYTEIILSHFGVTSPDARLQRPEYLGGGSAPINIHPIAQTSSTDVTTPQGNLAAFGTAAQINHGFSKSFTEHCIILGLVCARADLNYQNGMNRMWSRSTRFDFYWPALSHLGEQAILNQEIYCDGSGADSGVFGYQERYAEYRYKPSQVTGLFRSNATGTLDAWHLAQKYISLPTLGSSWIVEAPPMARVKAVSGQPDFIFDANFQLICARPMPVYSAPGLIDHF